MIVILGPTACGKTNVATHLAARIGAEIISADSRQVYRRMDIGTGKDLDEYNVDGIQVPYHLIDVCEPGEKYNLFEYQRDFLTAYQDIIARQHKVVMCGGTGLYIEAVVRGYQLSEVPQNPELRKQLEPLSLSQLTAMLAEMKEQLGENMHNTTDVDTAQRAIRAIEIADYQLRQGAPTRSFPQIPSVIVGLDIPREERRQRISERLRKRLDEGMVDEIRNIIQSGVKAEDLMYYGLEYKYVTQYVIGQCSYEEMYSKLEIAIHQFAKRQMTWFRGMERRGIYIHWVNAMQPLDDILTQILNITTDN